MLSVPSSFNQSISGPGGKSSGPAFHSPARDFLSRALSRCAAVLAFLFFAISSQAQTWQRLGPAGGDVISLASAQEGAIYLGTPDGHIFVSSDRGDRWQLRGRVGTRLDAVVQRIMADPKLPGRVLAAVWFQDRSHGGGLFESLDGAQHWKVIGLEGEAVRALENSASDPRIWVAGTLSGVFLSTDDAHVWQRITRADDPELQNVDSLAIDPVNPSVIYVGTYHLPWKTTDAGKTWKSIAAGMIDDSDIMSLRIDSTNPQRIFSSACSGIYRSEDAGASWTKLGGIPYSSRRTQQIVQDPRNPSVLLAATTEGLWQTADSGESWRRVTAREMVSNAVLILPDVPGANASRILVGAEAQGIMRSDDSAVSFAVANEGFSHRVISSVASGSRFPSHLVARVEGFGNKLNETRDGGLSWAEFPAGAPSGSISGIFGTSSAWRISFAEGGLAEFDPAKGKWLVINFRDVPAPNSAARKAQRAKTSPKPRIVTPHVTAFLERPEELFVATDDGLWRKKASETEFHRVPSKTLPSSITALAADPQNGLLAVADNALWSSESSTAKWNQIATPPESGRILWVQSEFADGNSFRLLGTEHGVFIAPEGSSWRLLSSGLPAIASNPPAISGCALAIALSNGGIYHSSDLAKSWQRVDTDFERGSVTGVFANGKLGFVVASQSEGLLRLDFAVKAAE